MVFIADIQNIFKLDNYGLSDDTPYLVKMKAFEKERGRSAFLKASMRFDLEEVSFQEYVRLVRLNTGEVM